jgi:signal transduction histidine kinase/ligand-binding sensor domain-containing protein
MRKNTLFIFSLLLIHFSFAQIRNKGIHFIKNYTNKDCPSLTLTWDILQDKRGIMYFATSNGIIEFDGNTWRTITLANKSTIRSLAMDKKGRIYVGAQVEFGYLEPDSIGNMRYVSLVNKIPQEERNFDDVWKIYDTEDGMVFHTNMKIYIFKDNKIKVLKAKTWFHTCFYINKVLYVRQQEIGLMEYKNGNLQLVYEGEKYANDYSRQIYSMLPYGPDKALIINVIGLYVFDGKNYQLLKEHPSQLPVKCAAALEDGNIAIGTISNGMFIMDKQGNLLQHIDNTKGLPNNAVLSMFKDKQGNLWLGLENGISYIETNSPFSFFNDKLKINGSSVYSLVENGKLYVGTNQGLYVADLKQKSTSLDPNANFKAVKGTEGEVRGLFSINGNIICGHHNGAFLIHDDVGVNFSVESGAWIFKQLEKNKPYIIEGTYFGLFIWEYKNGKFKLKNEVKGFNESSRYLEEDEDGNIWVSHANKGIFKITLTPTLDSCRVAFYGEKNGLPSNIRNKVCKIGSDIIFTTEKGVYKYDKKTDRFFEEPLLTSLIGRTYIKGIFPDKRGNLWFIAEKEHDKGPKKPIEANVLLNLPGGTYKYQKIPFYKFNDIDIEFIEPIDESNTLMPGSNGILFATPEGVILYDPEFPYNNIKFPYTTIIRKVEDINEQDSLIFNGAFLNKDGIAIIGQTLTYSFPYTSNAVRFNVASNQYENIEKMEYQYLMEGLDDRWSAWTNKAQKEYTNLPEGKYIFHARARNIHGVLGKEAIFEFSVNPPWYRTYLAFLIYGIAILFTIWITIKIYTIRLRKLNLRLENIINERTQEIQQKNTKLELQKNEIELKNTILEQNNKDLFELNEEKTYVLEVVSHDLRSPINQIKGIASLFRLTSSNLTDEQKENIVKIFKATERLTTMISKILNANSIESRKIDLKMELVNVTEVVPTVVESFAQSAKEKNITLHVSNDSRDLYSSLDKHYFIQILENLISNAIKFSEFNKRIFVRIVEKNERVLIQVEDEGPGLSADDMKKLFGKFQKLSAKPTGGEQSIGLGLSIVKKYVDAMNGEVSCESSLGKGTTFTIQFNLYTQTAIV